MKKRLRKKILKRGAYSKYSYWKAFYSFTLSPKYLVDLMGKAWSDYLERIKDE